MKRMYWVLGSSLALLLPALGQTVVERGPHHNVLQSIETEEVDGQIVTRTNEVTLLGTGINFWDEQHGNWTPSSNEIELLESGATYRQGQFKLIFAANVNDANGNLEWFPTANERIVVQTVGLAMREIATGNAVFFAQIKDTQGFLTAPHQITYPACFDNIDADIRVSVNALGSGFENDVILHERAPDPATFGFQGECRIEAWHEVLSGPQPELQNGAIQRASGVVDADAQLRFGNMTIGPGTAFLVGANADELRGPSGIPARVGKQYFTDPQTQMRFLVESVPLTEVSAHLQQLPPKEGAWKIDKADKDRLEAAWKPLTPALSRGEREKLTRPVALTERKKSSETLVAAITRKEVASSLGLLLDFSTLLDQTNFTFRGDTTYLVTNTVVNLSGTTVIEPGCVIKFNAYDSVSQTPVININGSLDCRTLPYAPCVLTSRDDRTAGETNTALNASVQSTPYGAYHLKFTGSSAIQLHDIRSRFAQNAFGFLGSGSVEAWNIQSYNTHGNVFEGNGNSITLRNILVHKANNVARAAVNNTAFSGEHATIHSASKTFDATGSTGSTFSLVNSLLVVVTNTSSTGLTLTSSDSPSSDDGIFQNVGSGAHYLADNTYRNTGSTSISTNLSQGVFKYSTTYPPIVLANNFSVNTTLAPQAPRDLDGPDRGYHYPALDWAVTNVTLSASTTLTLTNGVAVAFFGASGITMASGSSFISEGRPLQLNRMVRYNTVQEQPIDWGTVGATMRLLDIPNSVTTVSLRLTEITHLAYTPTTTRSYIVYQTGSSAPTSLLYRDCEVYSTWTTLTHTTSGSPTAELRNNLFHRGQFNFLDGSSTTFNVSCYNNLFRWGTVSFYFSSPYETWSVYNNLFDNTTISLPGSRTPSNSNNGYIGTSPMSGGGTSVATADYQTGVQGRWYYPTTGLNLAALINAGSMSVANAQLYHYTTRTDHTKDTGNVDIGYHYVAIDTGGPTDGDGDGIPDYLEDRDGDGVADTGELSWTAMSNGATTTPGLILYTPLIQ